MCRQEKNAPWKNPQFVACYFNNNIFLFQFFFRTHLFIAIIFFLLILWIDNFIYVYIFFVIQSLSLPPLSMFLFS